MWTIFFNICCPQGWGNQIVSSACLKEACCFSSLFYWAQSSFSFSSAFQAPSHCGQVSGSQITETAHTAMWFFSCCCFVVVVLGFVPQSWSSGHQMFLLLLPLLHQLLYLLNRDHPFPMGQNNLGEQAMPSGRMLLLREKTPWIDVKPLNFLTKSCAFWCCHMKH